MHSEKAVEDGLAWIVRHQRANGSWSLNFQEQCQGQGCPSQHVSIQTPRRPAWPCFPCWVRVTSTP